MSEHDERAVEPIRLLLMDRARMAASICVSEDTLDLMRRAGCPQLTVPGTKKVLFDPAAVVDWLRNQQAEVNAPSLAAAKEHYDVVFGKRSA